MQQHRGTLAVAQTEFQLVSRCCLPIIRFTQVFTCIHSIYLVVYSPLFCAALRIHKKCTQVLLLFFFSLSLSYFSLFIHLTLHRRTTTNCQVILFAFVACFTLFIYFFPHSLWIRVNSGFSRWQQLRATHATCNRSKRVCSTNWNCFAFRIRQRQRQLQFQRQRQRQLQLRFATHSVALLRRLRFGLSFSSALRSALLSAPTAHTHTHSHARIRSLSQKPVFLSHSQLATLSGCGLC